MFINETEPSLGEIPDEPLRSLLELITKSPFLTILQGVYIEMVVLRYVFWAGFIVCLF